ncbi:M28 family peptidase [Nocardioides sp. Root140]|uniref:M28 family peptidase n=1 Tax=Nocardioides sp. Root140 TaxID=1736460 RepID=UPI0006F770C7|nr:M28 family peptidase [Nocardioides sp. Root140]KQY56993.1 hypothetical protein ASD30_12060 [Nocardioides sp. Root140]
MTHHSRWLRTTALLGGAALLAATAAQAPATADPDDANNTDRNNNSSRKLRAAVTPEHVMERIEALSDIAAAHDGNRASGTPGFAASRDYVVDTLEAAGYSPVVQEFDFPYFAQVTPSTFERVTPEATTYVEDTDFGLMDYSGSGDVTATVQSVDLNLGDLSGSTSGCEAEDFAGFTAGNIALIRRGGCTFGVKVLNAEAAGATGVIIMNTGTDRATDAFSGTLGGPDVTVPAVGTSFAIGQSLDVAGTSVHLATSTESEIRPTWNITADTNRGNDANVVMAGAHLDSVTDGAGMNDNASGSATLLEVAVQMKKVKPRNTVRFAWWGAEEAGLLGSTHYVADLAENDPEALDSVAAYLNFDMIGSPNYGLFVLDGDNSRFPPPDAAEGPEGSGAIEALFHGYFDSQGLVSEEAAFTGRSDYGPFIEAGIPSGGLFTGHEAVKTEAQAEAWGGTVGEEFDPCYHAACDGVGNVSVEAIDHNSDAMAHVIITLAGSTRGVN